MFVRIYFSTIFLFCNLDPQPVKFARIDITLHCPEISEYDFFQNFGKVPWFSRIFTVCLLSARFIQVNIFINILLLLLLLLSQPTLHCILRNQSIGVGCEALLSVFRICWGVRRNPNPCVPSISYIILFTLLTFCYSY